MIWIRFTETKPPLNTPLLLLINAGKLECPTRLIVAGDYATFTGGYRRYRIYSHRGKEIIDDPSRIIAWTLSVATPKMVNGNIERNMGI